MNTIDVKEHGKVKIKAVRCDIDFIQMKNGISLLFPLSFLAPDVVL